MKSPLLGLVALSAAAALSAQTATMPDPAANGGIAPTSLTAYPWSRVGSFINVLYMYGNASFASQGITFPILINGVDTWTNAAAGAGVATYPNVTVYVGEGTPGVHAAYDLSQTFDWHYASGTLPAPAFTGSVTTVATGAPGYFAPITFPVGVLFDPTSGADLNVQYYNDGSAATGTGTSSYGPTGAGSLVSRIYTITAGAPLDPTTGSLTYGVQTQITYNPASGLYPSFIADVQTGDGPLTVNFTDTSFSSDPAGVIGWSWDLDGDGTPDSNVQNPSFTYNACGEYNVTLTAVDASHGPVTVTETAFITVDPLEASFTSSALGANMVSFTDTSSSSATTWSWDFDADGIIDSTAQNPVHTYPASGYYNCTLTVANGCRTSTFSQNIPTFPVLSTTFAGGNGLSAAGAGNLFDVIVTNPNGILITGLDVSASVASPAGTVEVWLAPTTYVGNETNAAIWHKVAEATNVNLNGGYGSRDFVDINDIYLPPGSHGVRVATSGGVSYTNGASTTPASNLFSNSDLTIACGAGQGALGGSVNNPRMWNGCIYYDTDINTGFYSGHRAGCDGSSGRTSLTSATVPAIGQTHVVDLAGMPASTAAILVLGYGDTAIALGPLPVDLSLFGLTGCPGNIEPQDTFLVLGDAAGNGSWSLPIPNVPAFVGTKFWNQALVVDPGVNTAGAVMSDSAVGRVGL